MITAVAGIFVLAALAPWLYRALGERVGWLLALGPAGVCAYCVAAFARLEQPVFETVAWAPSLGVELAFVGDGLSLPFAMLVSGVGALIVLYTMGYMHGQARLGLFYSYLLLFMGAMLGLVLSDSLLAMFVFWELTSVSSYLLIGFNHDSKDNRDAALKALFVTGSGGLALLGGVVLLGLIGVDLGLSPTDSLRATVLAQHGQAITQHPLYLPMLLLVLAGAFTKSAQVPFHFWLPAAMAGPTPVSAYLHSATMVKAGVFLLARLHPAISDSELFTWTVTGFGAATMVTGAVMAVGQRDLKAILAYTTLSVLGTLVMLLGIGSNTAIAAAVVFLFAHALYKAALFMVAGNVDHEAGTRDITQLGGLRHAMAVSAAAGLIAALSKAGAPPMFGYLSKKLVFEAKLGVEAVGTLLIALAVVANVCMVAAAALVAVRPFFGKVKQTPRHPHEAPLPMLIGPVVLAGLSLFTGLMPAVFSKTIGPVMARTIAGEPVEMKLKLLLGFSTQALLVTALSFGALLLGWLVYRVAHRRFHPPQSLRHAARFGPTAWYTRLLEGIYGSAALHTRWVQAGYLRWYVLAAALVFAFVVGHWAWRAAAPVLDAEAVSIRPIEFVVVLAICAGALYTLFTHSRLAMVMALGVAGLGIAVVFAMFGAPDLAITQLMVETLMVAVLALVLVRMPRLSPRSSGAVRVRDLLVAAFAGSTLTVLILASASVHLPADVSRYFLQASLPEAFGRNVVNVILVDFRGFDTMGEITVVAVAGLIVFALLKLRASCPPPGGKPGGGRDEVAQALVSPQNVVHEANASAAPRSAESSYEPSPLHSAAPPSPASPLGGGQENVDTVIIRTASRFIEVLLVVFSVLVLLRGHNEPGGGFIGGLLIASAFVLHALVHGPASAAALLRVEPGRVMGAGLLLAALSGCVALLQGQPFMTGQWWGSVPGVGKVGTVLLFDAGVYLVVLGATVRITLSLLPRAGEA